MDRKFCSEFVSSARTSRLRHFTQSLRTKKQMDGCKQRRIFVRFLLKQKLTERELVQFYIFYVHSIRELFTVSSRVDWAFSPKFSPQNVCFLHTSEKIHVL